MKLTKRQLESLIESSLEEKFVINEGLGNVLIDIISVIIDNFSGEAGGAFLAIPTVAKNLFELDSSNKKYEELELIMPKSKEEEEEILMKQEEIVEDLIIDSSDLIKALILALPGIVADDAVFFGIGIFKGSLIPKLADKATNFLEELENKHSFIYKLVNILIKYTGFNPLRVGLENIDNFKKGIHRNSFDDNNFHPENDVFDDFGGAEESGNQYHRNYYQASSEKNNSYKGKGRFVVPSHRLSDFTNFINENKNDNQFSRWQKLAGIN